MKKRNARNVAVTAKLFKLADKFLRYDVKFVVFTSTHAPTLRGARYCSMNSLLKAYNPTNQRADHAVYIIDQNNRLQPIGRTIRTMWRYGLITLRTFDNGEFALEWFDTSGGQEAFLRLIETPLNDIPDRSINIRFPLEGGYVYREPLDLSKRW